MNPQECPFLGVRFVVKLYWFMFFGIIILSYFLMNVNTLYGSST